MTPEALHEGGLLTLAGLSLLGVLFVFTLLVEKTCEQRSLNARSHLLSASTKCARAERPTWAQTGRRFGLDPRSAKPPVSGSRPGTKRLILSRSGSRRKRSQELRHSLAIPRASHIEPLAGGSSLIAGGRSIPFCSAFRDLALAEFNVLFVVETNARHISSGRLTARSTMLSTKARVRARRRTARDRLRTRTTSY
jgi:hypothetical protein